MLMLVLFCFQGNYDLLKHLFCRYAKTSAERSAVNDSGATLLHVACSWPGQEMSNAQKELLIQLLLNNEVDATVRDKHGKLAKDYLPSGMTIPELVRQTNIGVQCR